MKTTAIESEIRDEIDAEAKAAWDKDYKAGSGDDHCHTFTKAMGRALSKWGKADSKEIDECWFGGEAAERAEMIWALAYRSAKKYANGKGMTWLAAITFAKDAASVATCELLVVDKKRAAGSAKKLICGMGKNRAMNAARDGGKATVKAFVSGKEKGAYAVADMAVGEAYGDLYNAMAALLVKDKDWFDIVDKAFFKGMTYEEIAKEASLGSSTIKEKAKKAFAFLKGAMAYA